MGRKMRNCPRFWIAPGIKKIPIRKKLFCKIRNPDKDRRGLGRLSSQLSLLAPQNTSDFAGVEATIFIAVVALAPQHISDV